MKFCTVAPFLVIASLVSPAAAQERVVIDRMVAEALASGATDFALTGFTPAAFNFAGKGAIKAIAARLSRSTRLVRFLTISWSRSHGSRKST